GTLQPIRSNGSCSRDWPTISARSQSRSKPLLLRRSTAEAHRRARPDFIGTGGRARGFPWNGAVSATVPSAAKCDSRSSCVHSDEIREALVRRLRALAGITDEDVSEINALPIAVKQFPAERTVVADGEAATDCCLIAEGFCVRSKTLTDGKRQILSIHIPGEIPDLMSLFLHV